ncbi:MAG: hypothetical protein WC314_14495 [Vulcanimicrobiota bacterium]
MTDEFLNRLAADLFTNQEEIKIRLLSLKKNFGECAQIAREASAFSREAAEAAEKSAEAAEQAARAAAQAAKTAMQASRAVFQSSQRVDTLESRFTASEEQMGELVDSHVSQADKLQQIIKALGAALHTNVDTEVWRKEAEKRLTRIEDWIDRQDEAS